MPETPTLEVLAERIAHEREMRIALDMLLQTRERGSQKALELQAKEYERRLIDLNHEAARLKAAAALAVTVEKYDAERSADLSRLADLDRRLQETKDSLQETKESLLTVVVQRAAAAKWISAGIAVVVSVLGIIINLFLAGGGN